MLIMQIMGLLFKWICYCPTWKYHRITPPAEINPPWIYFLFIPWSSCASICEVRLWEPSFFILLTSNWPLGIVDAFLVHFRLEALSPSQLWMTLLQWEVGRRVQLASCHALPSTSAHFPFSCCRSDIPKMSLNTLLPSLGHWNDHDNSQI